MIHYHGTPIGGPRDEAVSFFRDRHALIPFARPDDLGAALEVCRSVCLDNSAFSLWKNGGDVDVAAYRAWVMSIAGHPSLDWCLIPDKIGGSEADNVDLLNTWLRAGCAVEGVPVWHLDKSLGYLDYLVSNFRTVALGSSGQWSRPGTAAWWDRMAAAMAVACDDRGRPRARLHGLRMLDPEVFTRLPLASADSTNAAVNSGSISRFGTYVPPRPWQRATIIAWCVEGHNSAPAWVSQGEQHALGF